MHESVHFKGPHFRRFRKPPRISTRIFKRALSVAASSAMAIDDTLVLVDKENQLPVDKEVTLSASSLLDRIKGHQKLFADDAAVAPAPAAPAAVHGAASEGTGGAASGSGPSLSPEAEALLPRPEQIELYRQKTLELGSDRGAKALSVWLKYAQLQKCARHPTRHAALCCSLCAPHRAPLAPS